ncbi:VCBS repeat-containing protein [Seonamhaeicola maritimus]|uniref:VCBS repeat-containing protein n=1 Tax=Seonamhaeicola maritimus TaxID=2591822 RepID=A0A5C7GG21_9FLAO|nr:VCBS repeat-containing protein [Seonamhaeicola maritimus]TXG36103.1 VCBS repeat-containing protein [Seonamhaeicola maritimus]
MRVYFHKGKISVVISFMLLLVLSCKENNSSLVNIKGEKAKEKTGLFVTLNDSVSGVSFVNKLQESFEMNALNYDYMYNGAGVSAADFNNDGLVDLYFVSNQGDNKLYLNKGLLKFEDVTNSSNVQGVPGFELASTIVDINADGLLDIYVCRSGPFIQPQARENKLYVNQGNNKEGIPVFEEKSEEYHLNLPHYSTQSTFFDYDRDGDLDMFLINHNTDTKVLYDLDGQQKKKSALTSDRLFRNENNIFVDVSDEAGILNDGIGFGLGVGVGDLNNDGWPDVLVSQDFASNDRIYLNQKDGTFKEVCKEATGHTSNFSMGNDIADFNNDGWLDFMTLDMVSEDNYGIKASMSGMNPERFNTYVKKGLHYQYMYNTLQLNNGVKPDTETAVFSDVAFLSGVSSTDWSWGPLFFDMDNDGDKDLFVSNGIKRDFRNVDFIHYRKKAEASYSEKIKKAPQNVIPLLERQRDEEILRRMPSRKKENYFFENSGNLSFNKRNGVWSLEKLTASNGATYADLDNDGDVEIITNNMDEVATIYKNNSTELGLGNFLKIQLKGPKNNVKSIGTRVSLKTKNGLQTQEQYFTRGFQSSVSSILHFGLGDSKEIDMLEVFWPDGHRQKLNKVKANQTVVLDYEQASKLIETNKADTNLFEDITKQSGINHIVLQNAFNDFERESLLPHKMSEEAIALCVGDLNNDGLDDFYVGGAKGFAGALFIQRNAGKFTKTNSKLFNTDKKYEDVDASFFDADNDGDLDLFVVSGGNEHEPNSEFYSDRLYINNKGTFQKSKSPFENNLNYSGSVVKPYDFDNDGDEDLFIGGRQNPGNYPFPGTSYLLRNDTSEKEVKFTKLENEILENIGMVTNAIWVDVDSDTKKELVVVGEWMPIVIFKNDRGVLTESLNSTDLQESVGWWFSLTSADFDNDGDMDLMVGNLGLNSKYQATKEKPFQIYANDFDNTGSLDIVLGYKQNGKNYPLRGRECSSQQMPFIKEKFPNYHDFAMAELEDVYGDENIEKALKYKATTFATSLLINNGSGSYSIKPLNNLAQTTAVKSMITHDFDSNGLLDALLFGNMYGFEVETPRQDAGYGIYLESDNGNFRRKPHKGLFVNGEVINAKKLKIGADRLGVLVLKNNDSLQLLEVK